jgi:hypothetical protein
VVLGAERLLRTGQLRTDRAQRAQVILLHAIAGGTAGASPCSVLAAPEPTSTLIPHVGRHHSQPVGQDTSICSF